MKKYLILIICLICICGCNKKDNSIIDSKFEDVIEIEKEELIDLLDIVPYKLYSDNLIDAYNSNLVTIDTIDKEILYKSVFNRLDFLYDYDEKVVTKYKNKFDKSLEELDYYIKSKDSFNKLLKSNYNIESDINNFNFISSKVYVDDDYLIQIYNLNNKVYQIKKESKLVKYDLINDELIIYEKALFIEQGLTNKLYKDTSFNNLIEDSNNDVKLDYNLANTFKHTFKYINGNYSWYSTEVSD